MPPRRILPPKTKHGKTQAGITTAILLVLATGCVVSPPQEEGETEQTRPSQANPSLPGAENPSEVVASSTTTSTSLGSDLQIDVYALERMENDLLRLRIGVTNKSEDNFNLGFGLSETDHLSAGSVSLIDERNQQRYLSYRQSSGQCFCNQLDGNIPSGETDLLWVMYPKPPEDLERMTVTTPLTPPIFDIPITSSSETIENSNLDSPQILDLTMISDSLDGDQTGRTESNEEVSIILSSDVLFDTNSAELTNEARDILEQVAQEIDDSGAPTVSIDGHADNTGNDSINIPLSQERAESVEKSLAEIITSEGITFEVEGHGSADPIADNETEEGRERNRRVSVTFEK